MVINIYDRGIPDPTLQQYDVIFYNDSISTIVTDTPSIVDDWIAGIEQINYSWLHNLVVGLDAEWPPAVGPHFRRSRVATLHLCVGRSCLIFQILRAGFIPHSLVNFLRNRSYTFVGVEIGSNCVKLRDNYSLVVVKKTDLGTLAAVAYNARELHNARLKDLAIRVLGREFDKPIAVTMSRWDNERLSREQVKYACVDAFVSFEIGKRFLIDGN